MTSEKTARFDKKLSRITNHLVLAFTKNKDYTNALRAIELRFKLNKQKQIKAKAHKNEPDDLMMQRINELEAIGIKNGWLNGP